MRSRRRSGNTPCLSSPRRTLTSDQHVAFAQVFGPMEPNINSYADAVKKDRIDDRVSDVSNLDEDDRILPADSRKRLSGLANRLWHTDSIFRHVPARASLLYARSVAPIGGHTEFADMRAAWDALPEATRRRIDGLKVEHSIFHSRAKLGFTDYSERERAALPPAQQVLVRTIPENRPARAVHRVARRARDRPARGRIDAAARRADGARDAAQFVYTHRWRVHDLVMWDNRCTMHRGTDYDERRWKRDMQRATVSDIGNTCELTESAPPPARPEAGAP